MLREQAHEPFLERLAAAADASGDETAGLVRARVDDLRAAIKAWQGLDASTAEARLFPLAQFMVDVYAGALLVEQAAWEERTYGTDRKSLVARLYVRSHLADATPLRGVDAPADDVTRFPDLADGALVDPRG